MSPDRSLIYVLGAGVDKPLGMPLANELMKDLGKFASSQGKPIADALRACLPALRFNFKQYDRGQGGTLAARVLSGDAEDLDRAKYILEKHIAGERRDSADRFRAVHTVLESIKGIRTTNEIDDDTLASLARSLDERYQGSGGDFIVNPKNAKFNPLVERSIKTTLFALGQDESIPQDDRDAIMRLAQVIMDFEEVLGMLFLGFYSHRSPADKHYLFLSWLLWTYLRLKMGKALRRNNRGLYQELSEYQGHSRFITMNYTSQFLADVDPAHYHSFHGDCLSRLDWRTRSLTRDPFLGKDESPDSLGKFITSLNIDLRNRHVVLPGIVPPLSVKPVMCREHLDTWYQCGQLIDKAKVLIVVGYSFNSVDEHFNDLLRKRKGKDSTQVVVIDPLLDDVVENTQHVLGFDRRNLAFERRAGFECMADQRLTFVRAKSEELSLAAIHDLIGVRSTT